MNTEPKNNDELRSLIDAMCDNTITDAQTARLEAMIESDEKALEFYIQSMWLDEGIARHSSTDTSKTYATKIDTSKFSAPTSIQSISHEPTGDTQMSTTVQNQKVWSAGTSTLSKNADKDRVASGQRSWVAVLAIACLIAIMTGLVFWLSAKGSGGIAKNNGSEKLGLLIGESTLKQPVLTQKVDATNLERSELSDGTIVIARSGSQFKVDRPRELSLEQGELYLIVAKNDSPFVVKTNEGEVHATGTRFAVSAKDKTEAAVAQGKVMLKSKLGIIALGAGQKGTLTKTSRPTRGPAKRISHLVNWAKEALKQNELLVDEVAKENGLVAIDPYGQAAKLSLRQYNVDVYIEDGVARTTIDQTFFNHNPWNTEGTFYFPLPPDASVARLAMYVAGNLNEGGMVSRERGQEIYTDILYQRRDPALLEMMEGNMFKMRIFPLEGRQEKRIFLSYTQNLDELYGASKYWFPMEHTNDVAKELSIRVHIKDGAKRFDPKSSTHDLKATTDGDDLVLEYNAEKIKPDQDFLLNLLPQKEKQQDEVRVAVCEHEGQQYLAAKLRPDLTGENKPEPRQWIVLNDVSASRSQIDAQAQKYVLERLVTEADDDDSVFLIDLNTVARNVSFKPVNVRSVDIKPILNHRAERLIGATNLGAGFKAAAEVVRKHQLTNPHILYLGDGVATDGEKTVADLPRLIPRSCKFVGIGIGKKVDSMFLQEAANRTGGTFTKINPNEDIDWRVFDLLASMNTPRMTNIRVELLDENDNRMEAIAYPSTTVLAAGETLTVTAMCDEKLPASIRFQGRVGENLVTKTAVVKKAKTKAKYLPRLWAKQHIDELLKSNMSDKEEIISLSKDFYVVTPYTSLIVLEDDAMYKEYDVERGRTDHWASYDAPKTIPVVKEPIDWNRWGWGWNFQSEDGKIQATTRPKTVQEIVDSIQIRVDAPFYLWNQDQTDSRLGLYALCSQSTESFDPSKYLTLYFLLSGGDRKSAIDWSLAVSGNDQSTNSVANDAKSSQSKTRAMQMERMVAQRFLFDGAFFRPMAKQVDFGLQGKYSVLSGKQRQLQQFARYRTGRSLGLPWVRFESDGSRADGDEAKVRPMPQLYGSAQLPLSPKMSQSLSRAVTTRWSRLQRDIEKFNAQWGGHWGARNNWSNRWDSIDARQTNTSWYGNGINEILEEFGETETTSGLSRDALRALLPAMSESRMDSNNFALVNLQKALLKSESIMDGEKMDLGRLSVADEISARGTLFGDQFAGGFGAGGFGGGGFGGGGFGGGGFGGGGGGFGGQELGVEGFMTTLEHSPAGFAFRPASIPISRLNILGNQSELNVQLSRFKKRRIQPQMYMALSQNPIQSQPGMTAILAADHLSRRLAELNKLAVEQAEGLTKPQAAEKRAVEAAIENMERVGANLEPNGMFWGYSGWSYQPRPQTFQPPTIQAYNGYKWSFDLTRYANGLNSNTTDMIHEVAKQYGSPSPSGKIDEATRKLITDARSNFKPVTIRFGDEGLVFNVGPNDQFAATMKNSMYLTKRLICDGANVVEIYDELGLTAQREASDVRLEELRRLVPHMIQNVESLIGGFDIELVETNANSTTLKLNIAEADLNPKSSTEEVDEENEKQDDGAANDEPAEIDAHLLVTFDHQGRILNRKLINKDKTLYSIDLVYKDDKVNLTWEVLTLKKEEDSDELVESTSKGEQSYHCQPLAVTEKTFKADLDDQVVIEMPIKKPSYYEKLIQEFEQKQKENAQGEMEIGQAISHYQHLLLAQIQEFNQNQWGYSHGRSQALLPKIAALKKSIQQPAKKGELALYCSTGGHVSDFIHNLLDQKKEHASFHESSLFEFFTLRHSGKTMKNPDVENGLTQHINLFNKNVYAPSAANIKEFRTKFNDSPLTLAMIHNLHGQKFQLDALLELNEDPRWAGMALLSSTYIGGKEGNKKVADAFWKWQEELAEKDLHPPLIDIILQRVRPADPKRLTQYLSKRLDAIEKAEALPLLMNFAERLSVMGEKPLADQAYKKIRADLEIDGETQPPLLNRFAFAQSLWAGNRFKPAYEQYQKISAELKDRGIPTSPGFVAASARLAQASGDLKQAIVLEEKALELEQPYLPSAINLQSFRQRYQWLWSQYDTMAANIPQDDPQRDGKMDEIIKRASATWQRWSDVDRDNAGLPQQMATLLKRAGRDEQAWEYLSTGIDKNPRDAQTYSMLGTWYQSNGDIQTAARWFGEAPQWDTANPQWIMSYGTALKAAGKPTEARKQFQKIIDGKWAPGLQRYVQQATEQINLLSQAK